MTRRATGRRALRPEVVWAGGFLLGAGVVGVSVATVPTTINDFFLPGTQPNTMVDPLYSAGVCRACHGEFNEATEPLSRWAASMMGQAARDPIFHACLAIANQDAAFAGDLCIRCHVPGGWLEGRSLPPDGSALEGFDFQGVSCSICHRMVDPVYRPGVSPPADQAILAALTEPVVNPHSANYVIDPLDRRRGPFIINHGLHNWLRSPLHQSSNLCATCHDVSNPVYTRRPDGTYVLGPLDEPHPTQDKYDQFPVERTFSEWSKSAFAVAPIDMGGRFGGNLRDVSTCQDCHMPDTTGQACAFGAPTRTNLPQHDFNGGNTWVLGAVHALYDPIDTFLSDESVAGSIARALSMLERASDVELTLAPGGLHVRVVNQTGHKLPTGYPEGRRMWINVRFLGPGGTVVAERGAYDPKTATLSEGDTKVYEAELGLDASAAALTGLPEGPGFHFAVNNTWFKDNRIPPRGFTNAGFAEVQAAPVAYAYADGQYWDDTTFLIPPGAASADVRVYFQTTSREYIEFLRDANTTNTAGQIAYDQWVQHGMSAPALMDSAALALPFCAADFNGDGALSVADFLAFIGAYSAGDARADLSGDGLVNVADFLAFLNAYAKGC